MVLKIFPPLMQYYTWNSTAQPMLCLHDEGYILLFTFFATSSSCLLMGTTDGGSFILSDIKVSLLNFRAN
jgi:hypothetical protein